MPWYNSLNCSFIFIRHGICRTFKEGMGRNCSVPILCHRIYFASIFGIFHYLLAFSSDYNNGHTLFRLFICQVSHLSVYFTAIPCNSTIEKMFDAPSTRVGFQASQAAELGRHECECEESWGVGWKNHWIYRQNICKLPTAWQVRRQKLHRFPVIQQRTYIEGIQDK